MPYRDPAKQRAAQLAYYYRNRDRYKASRDKWRREHPERYRELQRRYHDTEAYRLAEAEARANDRLILREVRACRTLVNHLIKTARGATQ